MESSTSEIILITGANRSIGFAILQTAAQRRPHATFILCSREVSAGEKAIQELREKGITAKIEVLQLDVTNDESIKSAVEYVDTKYGRLDVLVNNAGMAKIPEATLEGRRAAFTTTLNTNVASIDVMTFAFQSLLRKKDGNSATPSKIINVSSTRGSMTRSATGELPATIIVAYSVSKAALNALTLEWQKTENEQRAEDKRPIDFYSACPGHCKTAFNGYRGHKDPLDGAEVVVRLFETTDKDLEKGRLYEFENGGLQVVPW